MEEPGVSTCCRVTVGLGTWVAVHKEVDGQVQANKTKIDMHNVKSNFLFMLLPIFA